VDFVRVPRRAGRRLPGYGPRLRPLAPGTAPRGGAV